jgi:fermentation-respiration switch protein FrsA (DUF1100 family)
MNKEGLEMIDTTEIDHSVLDRPEILMMLFYPREEYGEPVAMENIFDLLIPVEEGVELGTRFFIAGEDAPNILFFHGNGEIVSDYNDMGTLYNEFHINFFPVDYRGYGRSTGSPTITSLIRDSHPVFKFVHDWLRENGHTGPLIVMGRSLGSAPAMELIPHYTDQIDGLIVESGFASLSGLYENFGLEAAEDQLNNLSNVLKIATFDKPTLIIHGENDTIVSFENGQNLYEASAARGKRLLRVPGAGHNDLLAVALVPYMEAVTELVDQAMMQQ